MMRELVLKLSPAEAADPASIRRAVAAACGVEEHELTHVQLLRRSIDARSMQPAIQLRVCAYFQEMPAPEPILLHNLQDVASAKKKVVIVGAGPAGYFAALELIDKGVKPIVLDRGTDVRTRRRDLRAIQQFGIVNPHSNYCFGEGGAGTYSDGKLYTRSHKRGSIEKALRLLVEHGADTDILVDAHPHIGSNKLPQIVANIRETILKFGGDVLFGQHVTDFVIHQQSIKGVIANDKTEFLADAVILATGHSARDIYELLHTKNIRIEAKPFALGVRVEHPQTFIDTVQYRQTPREENLPAASYKLVCQVGSRGVFSFCMCPGGLIVPAATAPGEIVVNGMSLSRRDSAFANSGIVTAIELEDIQPFIRQHGVFACMAFQQQIEQTMFSAGNGSQQAPALRLPDFVNKKLSASLNESSYIPGLFAAPLYDLLPTAICTRLQKGFLQFAKMMPGYFTSEANVVGTESRTSSPIRIPRQADTLMHPDIAGLYPCGEGAGYAGGIISAAMDGQNVAGATAKFLS